jgi:hypothetical protein
MQGYPKAFGARKAKLVHSILSQETELAFIINTTATL